MLMISTDINSQTQAKLGGLLGLSGWRKRIFWFSFWTLLGLLHSIRHFFSIPGTARAGLNYWETLLWSLNEWYLWGLLSIAIVFISKKIIASHKSWVLSISKNIIASVIIGSVHVVLFTMLGRAISLLFRDPYPVIPCLAVFVGPLGVRLFYSMMVYTLIASVIYAINFYKYSQSQEQRAVRIESRLVQAQLDSLKMQLHPHFLFNTLNTITALIPENPDSAEAMITRLGDLLRLALDNQDIQKVPLHQELEFLDRYLDIQKMRFEDRLKITRSISPDTMNALIPSLILQPIAENAIRHGISRQPDGGELSLEIRRENQQLVIQVGNTGPKIETPPIKGNQGRGMANTRERLAQLYGDSAELTLRILPEGGAVARLSIPYDESDSEPFD